VGSVTLPRWALVGLVAALAASLLALAFSAGRASVPAERRAAEPIPRPSQPRNAPALPAPPATATPEPAVPAEVDLLEALPATRATQQPAALAVAPPPTPRPGDTTAAGRVAEYLARVERIQGSGGLPEGSDGAERLLTAVLQGDTSGFDRLIAETRRAESEVQTIQAPPECRAYHASLVALLGESRALMTDLRAAIAGEDAERLSTLGAAAASLQTKAEELRVQDQELRRTYGLPAE
jgi:hypothetical protein